MTVTTNTMRFLTDTGIEVPAVTAEQMREVDRIANQETGPNLFQMMENAGRNLALLAMAVLGEKWTASRIVVLARSGGNGGGGICAARHLANRGLDVRLCLAEPDHLEEARECRFWRSTFRRDWTPQPVTGLETASNPTGP